jgi:trimeric autotransporter adhesin
MKSQLFTFVMVVVFTGALFAQSTTIKLPTADNTSSFVVTDNNNTVLSKIYGNGEFYMLGNYNGAPLSSPLGSGPRLTWDPYNAAFRAGSANGPQWDAANIGDHSTAMGYNTKASGVYSTAMGVGTTASGNASTAIGTGTTASGTYSVAMGSSTTASGGNSTAMGYSTTASGLSSTAMGVYVSTNGYTGSCIIGDASTATVTSSSVDNQMDMRFDGGYILWTKGDLSTGVYMHNGASGWSTFCDRNKKHNFRAVDGEELLRKIRTLPITEWSYKGTDPSVRYIGPMAQDFYAAFHLGGTDSLGINSISIDGVNMAAIQALEKRTGELQKATAKIAELEKQTGDLQTSLNKLSAVVQTLVDEKKNVSMNVAEKKEQ